MAHRLHSIRGMQHLAVAVLLAAPTTLAFPYAYRWGAGEMLPIWMAHVVLLAGTLLASGLGGRLGWRAVAVWLGALVLLWARFWVLDLWRARFALVLLVVPPIVVAGGVLGRARGAVLALCVGMSFVFTKMVLRAELAGCTGVSEVYDSSMLGTMLSIYGLGPLVIEAARSPRR